MRKRTQERILVIVNYVIRLRILKEPELNRDRLYGNERLFENLIKLGFDSSEINSAFEFILKNPEKIKLLCPNSTRDVFPKGNFSKDQKTVDFPADTKNAKVVSGRPVWIFTGKEQIKLSPQLQGELLRLYQKSYITLEEMFEIVNCAMQMESVEISVSDLAYLISRVIKETNKVESLLLGKDSRMLS